jgi:hypothetical protein
MHKDSVELAAKLGLPIPREAVQAAREALVNQQAQIRALGDKSLKEARIDRGPWDDIKIIQSQVLYLRQPSADWTAIRTSKTCSWTPGSTIVCCHLQVLQH